MNSTNTRRWPRYHVHLPVFIAPNPEATDIVVPGLVCELSRSGMEIYGGVNLQPGEMMEVQFRTSGRVRVAGIIRNRSGFCFGLEFCAVHTEPEEAPDVLQSQMLAKHEAYLREMQQKITQSLHKLEMRKSRKRVEVVPTPRPPASGRRTNILPRQIESDSKTPEESIS
jgi:PilZ domain